MHSCAPSDVNKHSGIPFGESPGRPAPLYLFYECLDLLALLLFIRSVLIFSKVLYFNLPGNISEIKQVAFTHWFVTSGVESVRHVEGYRGRPGTSYLCVLFTLLSSSCKLPFPALLLFFIPYSHSSVLRCQYFDSFESIRKEPTGLSNWFAWVCVCVCSIGPYVVVLVFLFYESMYLSMT